MFRAPAQAVKANAAAIDVVAFAVDGETEAVLGQLTIQMQTGAAHVARGSVRDAVRFLEKQDRAPRLLIVDVSGADMPLSEIDALAEACEPGVSVVVLGDRQDVGLFRELIRLGVTDYLVKPVLPDLIAPYLSGAKGGLRQQPHRTGKVVAIVGARGGLGTTTTATGLATLFSGRHNRRCVLVDLNPFGGSAGMQLGAEPGGLLDALENADRLDALFLERALTTITSRLFLLSGEAPFDQDARPAEGAIEGLLQTLEREFHYVLIDLPQIPGSAFAYVLRRANVRVLVADRTVPAMRGLTRLLGLMNDTAGRTLLVLNDHRANAEGLADRKTIEESLSRPFDLVLPYDRALARTVDNLGESLAETGGPFAKALIDLTAVISGQPRRKAGGWLRLIGRG